MSEDERPDPAKALIEGFQALRAISDWLEVHRPAFERLARAMAEIEAPPEVHAAIEVGRAESCHCLCARAHPHDEGICEAFSPVTTRRFGQVDVPLCAPCAAAQCVTELAAPQDGSGSTA